MKSLKWSAATRTDLAMEQAFTVDGADSIYLFSDGIPERRDRGKAQDIPQDEILSKVRALNRTRKLRVNCYGIAGSKTMRDFLRRLAEENDGEYQDIR